MISVAPPDAWLLLDNPRQLRDQAFTYLNEYFRAAAGRNPLLIMLEDLHWADDGSLDAIASLAAALEGYPAMLCGGAARPTLYERRPDWLANRPAYRRLRLGLLEGVAGSSRCRRYCRRWRASPIGCAR